ncbi:hypothetical protein DET49_107108 [Salegentibacter sp. 24]|nr:hypothetical protein DET49_107108 [Salegentibacter sp. 24]
MNNFIEFRNDIINLLGQKLLRDNKEHLKSNGIPEGEENF